MLFYLATIVSLSLFAVTLRLAENVAPFQCSHMGWYTSSAAIVVAIAYYLIAKCLYRCATFILSEKSRSRARLVEIMANMRRRNEAAGLGEGRDGSVEGDGVDDLDAVGPEGAEPIFTIVEEEEEQADGCEMENHIYKTDVEAQHTQTAPSNNVAAGRKRKGGGRRLRKLGALREMFSVGRIYSSVYGLGLGMYFLIYALQMHDSYGNIVFCIALWCVASYEYIDQFIVAPRTELPMTRPLKLLCELLSKDRRNYLILPCILGFYPLVIATHGIHAFFSLGTQDAIDRTDALDVVVNTLFPLLGVMLIKHARPRSNVIETMEVASPTAAIIAGCCCVVFVTTYPECVLRFYFHPTDGGTDVSGDMRDDALHVYVIPAVSFFVLPILATMAFLSASSNLASCRTVDLAMWGMWAALGRMRKTPMPPEGFMYSHASVLMAIGLSVLHVAYRTN